MTTIVWIHAGSSKRRLLEIRHWLHSLLSDSHPQPWLQLSNQACHQTRSEAVPTRRIRHSHAKPLSHWLSRHSACAGKGQPHFPTAMPPQERDLQALYKKYDKAHIGLECGTGWTDLLDATFVLLNDIAADRDWTPSQIKEKFGCLRLYWYGDLPERTDEVISADEHLSRHLCDVCGGVGVLGSQHGWWSTRCKEHSR